jgi:hypothetical protein
MEDQMRRTAIGKVLENLDTKIGMLESVKRYMQNGATVETLASDIARLEEVRDLVAAQQPPASEAKPRKPRTRKPKAA